MKKILLALVWPLCAYPLYAQKEIQKEKRKNDDGREVIIITSSDKDKKLTVETKDGEVYINGKPAKEYKDDDVSITRQRFRSGQNFLYTPGGGNFKVFDNKWNGFNNKWSGFNKAFLGVSTEKADEGVKITDVTEGSAADKAGLKEGDIITKVGDKKITDEDDLLDAVSNHKPKEDVSISYKRDGKAADTKATLGETSYSRSFSFNGSGSDEGNFYFSGPKIAKSLRAPQAYPSLEWSFGHKRLGVRIEDTENDNGAKIIDVDEESLAAKAGLKENDVITEVNGKKVKDVNEVRKEIAEIKDKNSYNIKAKRNGSDMNFEIKIPKRVNKADL
jgi:serine protease Do